MKIKLIAAVCTLLLIGASSAYAKPGDLLRTSCADGGPCPYVGHHGMTRHHMPSPPPPGPGMMPPPPPGHGAMPPPPPPRHGAMTPPPPPPGHGPLPPPPPPRY